MHKITLKTILCKVQPNTKRQETCRPTDNESRIIFPVVQYVAQLNHFLALQKPLLQLAQIRVVLLV